MPRRSGELELDAMTRIAARDVLPLPRRAQQWIPTSLTILWLVAGFGLYLSQTFLFQALGSIQVAVLFLQHVLWGLIQTIAFLAMIFHRRRDARILLPMMLVAGFMFFNSIGLFRRVGDQIAFNFVRASYDQAVAGATAAGETPVLLGFPWSEKTRGANEKLPTGRAIVYDETGGIVDVNAGGWRKVSPWLVSQIGGFPERCIPFARPHYFYCSFS
jgi:hypothetical protein